jgi:hypothetical protein
VKRLLDHDPLSGLTTWHDYDETTETTILHHEQDVQPILDANKEAENHGVHRKGEMWHVASIPVSIQLKWMVEKGVDILNPDHKQAVAKLLDDPEWKYLKRMPITLGRTR